MPETNGGYARIYRSILDNPAFRNVGEAMFFAFLVLKANWRAGERRYDDRVYKLDRGELVIGARKLAEEFGWSHKRVRTLIKHLIDGNMVVQKWAQHGAHRAPVTTICNYEKFQAPASEQAQAGAQQGHSRGTPKKEEEEKKERKKPTSPISPAPSSHHHPGGQKENDVIRDGSSEEMFWSLVDKAAAVNVTRGLMGKLARAMADFDKAYPALLGALDKKNPPAYVAKIIKNETQEQDARTAAAEGRDSGAPGFVQEAYRAGQPVERLPEGTWRIAGTIYSPEGEEVGW